MMPSRKFPFYVAILCPLVLCVAALNAQESHVLVYADMEQEQTSIDSWFSIPDASGGLAELTFASEDVPPRVPGSQYLVATLTPGNSTDYRMNSFVPQGMGGFGKTRIIDATEFEYFNFWIQPPASERRSVISVVLQQDVSGDELWTRTGSDLSFRFRCEISPNGPCANSDGEWQKVSIPLDQFELESSHGLSRRPVYFPGNATGKLANVVIRVDSERVPSFRLATDHWTFSGPEMIPPKTVFDEFHPDSEDDWESFAGGQGYCEICVADCPVEELDTELEESFLAATWRPGIAAGDHTATSYGGFRTKPNGPLLHLPHINPYLQAVLRVDVLPGNAVDFDVLFTMVTISDGLVGSEVTWEYSHSLEGVCVGSGVEWCTVSIPFLSFKRLGDPNGLSGENLDLARLQVELLSDDPGIVLEDLVQLSVDEIAFGAQPDIQMEGLQPGNRAKSEVR